MLSRTVTQLIAFTRCHAIMATDNDNDRTDLSMTVIESPTNFNLSDIWCLRNIICNLSHRSLSLKRRGRSSVEKSFVISYSWEKKPHFLEIADQHLRSAYAATEENQYNKKPEARELQRLREREG